MKSIFRFAALAALVTIVGCGQERAPEGTATDPAAAAGAITSDGMPAPPGATTPGGAAPATPAPATP